jgi:hypothetical protein
MYLPEAKRKMKELVESANCEKGILYDQAGYEYLHFSKTVQK